MINLNKKEYFDYNFKNFLKYIYIYGFLTKNYNKVYYLFNLSKLFLRILILITFFNK